MHREDKQYVWRKKCTAFLLMCRYFHLAEPTVLIVGVEADLPDALLDSHSVLKDAKL